MTEFSRRKIVGMSLGSLSALCLPRSLIAAPQCVTGQGAMTTVVLPGRLTVDCASRKNFQTFRLNPDYLGLAGVVTMTSARGRLGTYPAGNLSLFPWIKPKGKGKSFPAAVPASATLSASAASIPNGNLPVDEYFCRFVLQAPWTSFIGFQVDNAFDAADASRDWFSNVNPLADGKPAGIDWTSANLNNGWFGDSRWIPNDATCNGTAWRNLIIDGLQQASARVC